MTSLVEDTAFVVGVDTHKHTHTAAVVGAGTGGQLTTVTVTADPQGYGELIKAADHHPGARVWAIEGTGSYGAGLTRFLTDQGERVIEIDRPQRSTRRHGAKSDPIDAVRAAREALARDRHTEPKTGQYRGALAALLVARRSAVDAAGDAARQLAALVIKAPETLRTRFRGQSTTQMITTALRLRGHHSWDLETQTTLTALRALAHRHRHLTIEARTHKSDITQLVTAWRPDLLEVFGVGPITAAIVLCAWSHPRRIHSEGAFAMLAGTSPIPASSGQTNRHRLNRSGDRHLNEAINTIALCRLRYDPDTRTYAQRRQTQGHGPRDTRRRIKRYITRQLYRQLENPPT